MITVARLDLATCCEVEANGSAALRDLGDGCLGFELRSPGQTVDAQVIDLLGRGVERAEREFAALLVGNDGEHFGTGVALREVLPAAEAGDWATLDSGVRRLQQVCQRLRAARVPVVAAPFRYCLGAAAEIAMAATACQAASEVHCGLVEMNVGLVPAGGGCLRLLERWTAGLAGVPGVDPLPFLAQAFEAIVLAKVAAGGEECRRLRFLRGRDGVASPRAHLLAHAKARALGLAASGHAPAPAGSLAAAGAAALEPLRLRLERWRERGRLSPYDVEIAAKVLHVLGGGHVPAGTRVAEQAFLDLEREAFLSLCGQAKTLARMRAVLAGDPPLAN